MISLKDGVAQVSGLAELISGEMVEFVGANTYGLALNLERNLVKVVILDDGCGLGIRPGTFVQG